MRQLIEILRILRSPTAIATAARCGISRSRERRGAQRAATSCVLVAFSSLREPHPNAALLQPGTTLAALIGFACATPRDGDSVRIATAPPPSSTEQYCAWYGDRRDDVLYFGESPFWNAMRAAGGDPMADSHERGPQVIGRFDLRSESMLASVPTAARDPHAGVWDVPRPSQRARLLHDLLRVGRLGRPRDRRGQSSSTAAGTGLNELALRPDGRVLATRYGAAGGGTGSVVVLDPDGAIEAELPLRSRAQRRRSGQESRLRPGARGRLGEHRPRPARRRPERSRRARARVRDRPRARCGSTTPELHFPRFTADGRGFFAWQQGSRLTLRMTQPGRGAGRQLGTRGRARHRVRRRHRLRAGRARRSRRPRGRDALERHRARRRAGRSVRSVDAAARRRGRALLHGRRASVIASAQRYCADVSVVCAVAPMTGYSGAVFASRRQRVLAAMEPDSVALFLGAGLARRSNDTHFPFRQDSDFHYLTGFDHPNAAAVLRTDGGPAYTLFVEPRDRDAETWTGYRPGVEGAVAEFGADAAHPYAELIDKIPRCSSGRSASTTCSAATRASTRSSARPSSCRECVRAPA